MRIWSTDWWVDAVGTAEKVHQHLTELLSESRAKQAVIDAAHEAERLKVDAAMADVIEVVDQLAVVASPTIAVANDPSGALPELKYARAVTAQAIEEVVIPYVPVEHLVYKEADPTEAVEAVDPDRFLRRAIQPLWSR